MRTLLLISFLLISSWIRADLVPIDSLQSIWTNSSEADSNRFKAIGAFYANYIFSIPDSVLSVADYHYKLAEDKGKQAEMAEALNKKALAYYALNSTDSSLSQLHKALQIRTSMNDSIGMARMYANIGSVNRQMGQYLPSVRNYTLSLEIFREKKQDFERAEILINLGLIYDDVDMYDQALAYFHEALELYQELGIQEKMGNIWLNIGATQYQQGDMELAQENLYKSVGILEANNNKLGLTDCYYFLASTYRSINEDDSALKYAQRCIDYSEEIGNLEKVIAGKTLLGNLVLSSDLKMATELGEEVVSKVTELDDTQLKAKAHHLLYQCYKRQNRYEQSLSMLENYLTYHDSLQIELDKVAVVKQAIQSEFEIKLFNNQLENEKEQAQLKLDQLNKIYGIVAIGVILLCAILFYSQTRINTHRRQKAELLTEIEKLKSAGNSSMALHPAQFHLDRDKIEAVIERKLNETDWTVLNILLNDPVISNKGIAEQAHRTVDGIGSSLRRMYVAFNIKESKYKKISLLMEAMKYSNAPK